MAVHRPIGPIIRPAGRAAAFATIVGVVILVAALPSSAVVPPGSPGTIAEFAGGPGSGAALLIGQEPVGFAPGAAASGKVYVADQLNVVRSLSTSSATENVIAGVAIVGYSGDGASATAAELDNPAALVVDGNHNLVVADQSNNRVRVVAMSTGTFDGIAMTKGDIYTVAGGGTSAANGVSALSAFVDPQGVSVDAKGNLFIADPSFCKIRVVAESTGTFYGQAMTAGRIYTIAGTGACGDSGDGGIGTSAKIDQPMGVAVDHHGNVVFADTSNDLIRVVAGATGTFYGQAMTTGDIYAVAGDGTNGYTGDGGRATAAALNFPRGIAVDKAGNLVIADTQNDVVRMVALIAGTYYGRTIGAGDIATVAGTGSPGYVGDGGPATLASFTSITGVAVDASGNVLIADSGNDRARLVAASTGIYYGQPVSASDVVTIAGNGTAGSIEDGVGALSSQLNAPNALAIDSSGNVLEAEDGTNAVRVVAGSTGAFYGQAMVWGDIYTVAGNGTSGYRGDGGSATQAELAEPKGLAVDAAGDIAIGDTNNYRVRFIPAASGTYFGQVMIAGDIYTVAGDGTQGFWPWGVAFDAHGNLVICNVSADVVSVLANKAGTYYGHALGAGAQAVLAGGGTAIPGNGGPATSASIDPEHLTIDHSGNILLADSAYYRVRVVAEATGKFYRQSMTAGDIYTIAGNGQYGHTGDNGPAIKATVTPGSVALDPQGDVIISDNVSSMVRIVAETTATHYGKNMTAGDIYTIAGNGTYGFKGDGLPGQYAELAQPADVVVTRASKVIIADTGNNRLRAVVGP